MMETTTKPGDSFFVDLRKRCNFYFATNDSRTITQMAYGLSELTNDIHFYINTKGITYGQSLHRNNMLIYGILHGPKFDYFFCDTSNPKKQEHVIYFTVNHFYKIFSQGAPGDLLVVAQDKNKEDKLLIYLFSKGEENQIREYEITTMVPIEEERYEANVSQVSYILGLSTAEFTKYISCFHTLDAEFHPRTLLQISCSEKAFEMRIKGNLTIETAGVTVLKKKPDDKEGLTIEKQKKKQASTSSSSSSSSTPVIPEEIQEATKCIDERINEVARPEYRGAFRLRHLAGVQKCLNQNKGMLRLWLSNDQPMVAEVDIGGLGIQRITFMFCHPDDDDFEDEEIRRDHFFDMEGNKVEQKKQKIAKTLESQFDELEKEKIDIENDYYEWEQEQEKEADGDLN